MTPAEELARNVGAKRSGNQFLVRCPAHEDKHPSCMFWQGHTSIRVKCNSGCYAEDIIGIWRDQGAWPKAEDRGRRTRSGGEGGRAVGAPPLSPQMLADIARRRDLALAIWREAVDPAGTLVDRYLKRRGLDLSVVSTSSRGARDVIRFHPTCPRGEAGGGAKGWRQPAMICLMRDIRSDRPMAIHRRYLTPDGLRDGKPVTLGPVDGCAIKLVSHADTFCEALAYCSLLHIAEGVETGIAALMQNYRPLWSLGAAGEIKKFPPLFAVGELMVLADHDKAGIAAAQWVREVWRDAGKRASALMPIAEGCDFADVAAADPSGCQQP